MEKKYKEDSLIVDNTFRRMTLQQQSPAQKIKYQNVQPLKLKISILCLSTFYYGYCLAYLSTLSTNTMVKYFGQQSQNSVIRGFLIGILTLGGAVGAFTSPFWMKCFTRRNLVLLFNIGALIISGVIQYPNLYCLFVCRGIQGFILGNFMAIVPVYVNELTPKQIVGTFGVFAQLFVVVGIVFAYLLGIILTKSGLSQDIMWRIMFGFAILTSSTVIINCILGIIPESPNSLIMIGKQQEAKKVINMFIKDEYVQEVFKQKQLQVDYELNKKKNQQLQGLTYSKKAYFVGFLLPLMQQSTGINAIVTQIGSIVSQHNPQFGYYTPPVINIVQFLGTIAAIYALNSFGRKPILLFGNFGLGICDVIIGVLFLFIEKSNAVFWILFVILIIYMLIYGLTIGPTVWMYVPEIIPAKIVPFATTLNWVASSFCLIIAPIINQSLGSYAVFFIFGGLTLTIGVINFFSIVQIKGLNVKQICEAYR